MNILLKQISISVTKEILKISRKNFIIPLSYTRHFRFQKIFYMLRIR